MFNISYDWRPKQIWYWLKCFCWHRYSTIKPRYLDHQWCDRRELVPELMFEVLSQFIEQECSPGHVEWYGEYGHKVMVDGVEKYVRDEMQSLYDWWHKIYKQEYPKVCDILWDISSGHKPEDEWKPIEWNGETVFEWLQHHKSPDDEAIYDRCLELVREVEAAMDQELTKRLHRMVNIIPYMWT